MELFTDQGLPNPELPWSEQRYCWAALVSLLNPADRDDFVRDWLDRDDEDARRQVGDGDPRGIFSLIDLLWFRDDAPAFIADLIDEAVALHNRNTPADWYADWAERTRSALRAYIGDEAGYSAPLVN